MSNKVFDVTLEVTERSVYNFSLEAENKEEAERIARENYTEFATLDNWIDGQGSDLDSVEVEEQ
ncbi:MAG: hypothetical protein ACOCQR_02320 [bacterium]